MKQFPIVAAIIAPKMPSFSLRDRFQRYSPVFFIAWQLSLSFVCHFCGQENLEGKGEADGKHFWDNEHLLWQPAEMPHKFFFPGLVFPQPCMVRKCSSQRGGDCVPPLCSAAKGCPRPATFNWSLQRSGQHCWNMAEPLPDR